MRLRTTATAGIVLAAAMCFPLAGVAAGQDLDCKDFQTQTDAEAVYNQDPRHPNGLDGDGDGDGDGKACEALPGGPLGSAEGYPSGAVETGAGGAARTARNS